eukprot:5613465-Pyramimonas_sp.AAC.1
MKSARMFWVGAGPPSLARGARQRRSQRRSSAEETAAAGSGHVRPAGALHGPRDRQTATRDAGLALGKLFRPSTRQRNSRRFA